MTKRGFFKKIKEIWILGLASGIGWHLSWWGLSFPPGCETVISPAFEEHDLGKCPGGKAPWIASQESVRGTGKSHHEIAIYLSSAFSLSGPWVDCDTSKELMFLEHSSRKGWDPEAHGLLVLRKCLAHFPMQHVNYVSVKELYSSNSCSLKIKLIVPRMSLRRIVCIKRINFINK